MAINFKKLLLTGTAIVAVSAFGMQAQAADLEAAGAVGTPTDLSAIVVADSLINDVATNATDDGFVNLSADANKAAASININENAQLDIIDSEATSANTLTVGYTDITTAKTLTIVNGNTKADGSGTDGVKTATVAVTGTLGDNGATTLTRGGTLTFIGAADVATGPGVLTVGGNTLMTDINVTGGAGGANDAGTAVTATFGDASTDTFDSTGLAILGGAGDAAANKAGAAATTTINGTASIGTGNLAVTGGAAANDINGGASTLTFVNALTITGGTTIITGGADAASAAGHGGDAAVTFTESVTSDSTLALSTGAQAAGGGGLSGDAAVTFTKNATFTAMTMDDLGDGAVSLTFDGAAAQTITGTIDGVGAAEGSLVISGTDVTFASAVGATKGMALVNLTTGDATFAALDATAITMGSTGTLTLGGITGGNAVAPVTFGAAGTLAVNAAYTGDVDFVANAGTMTIADGITTTGATEASGGGSKGTLNFSGAATYVGTIGAGGSLAAVNFNGVSGKDVTVSAAVIADTITGGAGKADFAGNVTATTGTGTVTVGAGAMTFAENLDAKIITGGAGALTVTKLTGNTTQGTYTGAAGAATFTGVSKFTTITGGAGAMTFTGASTFTTLNTGTGAVTLTGDATGAINFAGDATITAAGNVTGAVTTATANTGTLVLNGAAAGLGAIGTTKALKKITIGAAVTSSGLVNATEIGIGVNALTVGAPTTLASGQSLSITANADATYGSIIGGANLITFASGSTVLMSATPTYYNGASGANGLDAGDVYKIVTGGNTPTSAATIVSNIPGYTFTSAINGNDVELTLVAKAAGTLTNNELVQQQMLVEAPAYANIDAVNTLVNAATTEAARDELIEALTPDVSGAAVTAVMSAGAQVQSIADTRIASLRDGLGHTGMAAGASANGTSLWFQGYGATSTQDKVGVIDGYDADTYGAAIGFDSSNLMPNGIVGLSFNYGQVNADSKDANTSSTDIDSFGFNLYSSFDIGRSMFLNAQAGYAYNDIDLERHNVGAGLLTARANTSSDQFSAKFALGRDYSADYGMTITPTASIGYVYVDTDGYTETGAAAGLNLTVQSQSVASLPLSLGVESTWDLKNSDGSIMSPAFRLGYTYDAIGDNVETTSTFGAGTTAFKTKGADVTQSTFNAGFGLTYMTVANWDFSADYDFTYRSDYDAHNGVVRGTFRF